MESKGRVVGGRGRGRGRGGGEAFTGGGRGGKEKKRISEWVNDGKRGTDLRVALA